MKDQTFMVLYLAVAASLMLMTVDYCFINSLDISKVIEFDIGDMARIVGRYRPQLLMTFAGSFLILSYVTGMYRTLGAMKEFTTKHKILAVFCLFGSGILLYLVNLLVVNYVIYPLAIFIYIISVTFFLRVFAKFQKLNDIGDGLTPEKLEIDTVKSFSFPCNGGGFLNVANPHRGIGIIGSNGSGKTASLFYPIIQQAIEKDYTAIVFDYKYPNEASGQYSLINKVFYEFKKKREQGSNLSLYYLNYFEPLKSHRVNFINPKYLDNIIKAGEIAETLLLNLAGKNKGGDPFWFNNARSLFTGVIWLLKKYYPKYCTIPHAILVVNNRKFGNLIEMMSNDMEIAPVISSITTAQDLKAGNQLTGVMSSLQTEFAKLLNDRIFWVHSADDFDLNINDPEDPKWVVIASHQSMEKSLAPVISCVVSSSLGIMNQPGKVQSLCLLDEGPTLFLPNIFKYPAVARSNKLSMVYSAQDFALMHDQLGKEMTDALLANLNFQFVGKLGNYQTAETYSKIIGKYDKAMKNISDGVNNSRDNVNTNQGVSYSHQERLVYPPEKLFDLEQGEFLALAVEGEKTKSRGKIKIDLSEKYTEVDVINPSATPQALKANYERIYKDAEEILTGVIIASVI